MTEIWEHQQLPRSEIDKIREEIKQASEVMDEARRKLIDKEKPSQEKPKN